MNVVPKRLRSLGIHTRAWPALAWTHLTVSGYLDRETYVELLAVVESTLEPGHRITLDLSEVVAVDSAGVRAIRECEARAEARDAELTVEDPSPPVRNGLRDLA